MRKPLVACAVFAAALAGTVAGHESRPAYLELRERGSSEPGVFEVLWKVPSKGGAPLAGEEIPHGPAAATDPATSATVLPCGCPVPTVGELLRGVASLHPSLPPGTENLGAPVVDRLPGADVRRWAIRTGPSGLLGWQVAMHGRDVLLIDVLLRVDLADGRSFSRLIRAGQRDCVLTARDLGPAAGEFPFIGARTFAGRLDLLLLAAALGLVLTRSGIVSGLALFFTGLIPGFALALLVDSQMDLARLPLASLSGLAVAFVAAAAVSRCPPSPEPPQTPFVAAGLGGLSAFGLVVSLGATGPPPGSFATAGTFFFAGAIGILLLVAAIVSVAGKLLSRKPLRQPWGDLVVPYAVGGTALQAVLAHVLSLF